MMNDIRSFLVKLFANCSEQKGFAAVAALAVVLGVNAAGAAAATDNVLISQVLYNPSGTNSGGEAVELHNPTAFSVNISSWVLATETSPTDATLPEAVICGGCYFLVADSNWSNAKDNVSWPNADYEEAITLANSDAGVALKDSNGAVVDAVGWGVPANIGSSLFEGSPHSGSSSGNSLIRKVANGSYVDSSNNSADFSDGVPFFRNSSSVAASLNAGEIGITIVVGGSGPVMSSLAILTDDDPFLPSSQVSPAPGSNRTVHVEAAVTDSNGFSDIASVILTFNSANVSMSRKAEINSTSAIYSGNFSLSSSFPAGSYSVTAVATDNSGFGSYGNSSFEYLTLTAVEIDASSIVFFAAPGASYEISGDSSASTASNITVTNAGNVRLDFDIWATNFTSGTGSIGASRLKYTFNGNYDDSGKAGTMSNSKAKKDVNLDPGSQTGLSLKLDMPMATSPGNYSGRISLVAVNS